MVFLSGESPVAPLPDAEDALPANITIRWQSEGIIARIGI
jgi:hypothetical protein